MGPAPTLARSDLRRPSEPGRRRGCCGSPRLGSARARGQAHAVVTMPCPALVGDLHRGSVCSRSVYLRSVCGLCKRPRQLRTDPQRWTAAEAAQFRAHVLTDRLAAAWLLSLAGLRRSEVLGLRWEDVDLNAGLVRIKRARVAVTPARDAVDEPKSEQSRRACRSVCCRGWWTRSGSSGRSSHVTGSRRARHTRTAAMSSWTSWALPRGQGDARTGSAGCAVTLECQ